MTASANPKTKRMRLAIPSLESESIAEWIEIDVPITRDPDTGEELLTGEALQMIDDAKARHMGLLQPAELKALRMRLGLTQKEIGELLQIGEKSWTRWEGGKARPSRSMNVLLRALNDGILPLYYLRALRKGATSTLTEFIKLAWESMISPAKSQELVDVTEPTLFHGSSILRATSAISLHGWSFVGEPFGWKSSYLATAPQGSYQVVVCLQPKIESHRTARYTPTEVQCEESWQDAIRDRTLAG